MTRQVMLSVNETQVDLDYFAQSFVDHVVAGMLESLEGTSPIKNLTLAIDGDAVAIQLNGAPIPTNPFASKIIKSTVLGMVSSLKGASDPKKLQLTLARGN
ncbi:MAG: hypothetical protein JXR83_18830 [Deltaproteobacteria bacterium]|nr:hypothetical protein [Deltaproteobacteria bacterium]